jgi:hypothetical protein
LATGSKSQSGYPTPSEKQRGQIKFLQDGAQVYAIDTIRWPCETFPDPIVYAAASLSLLDNLRGWTVISREQYEWLTQHFSCLVSYTKGKGHDFWCNNHQCWEQDGRDLREAAAEPEIFGEPDYYYEREI